VPVRVVVVCSSAAGDPVVTVGAGELAASPAGAAVTTVKSSALRWVSWVPFARRWSALPSPGTTGTAGPSTAERNEPYAAESKLSSPKGPLASVARS
jgi:hypothetical protein